MQEDERDLFEVLKSELRFLEMGGYSSQVSLGPKLVFEDSPTCVNCGRRDNPIIPCTECVLIDLVPAERRSEKIPCRHIPLGASGETLDSLYRYASPEEVYEALGNWLRATINRLEEERSAPHGRTRNGGSGAPAVGAGSRQAVCSVCGQASEEGICAACADKIRAEALADAAGEAPRARSKPGRGRAK